MNNISNYCFVLAAVALLAVNFSNCKGKNSFALDQDLSTKMRNIPSDPKIFSIIKIYKTTKNVFLNNRDISSLPPIAVLASQDEIISFFEAMSDGRTVPGDPSIKDFHYPPFCYHIIAFDRGLNNYGYLKCQVSSDLNKELVAKIQRPDGTNSFEYRKLIPEFIEKSALEYGRKSLPVSN